MRKMISFKIENLPAKEREIVDRWADEQTNIQQSLANIVMHVVKYVGNVDVMDFDVQHKLHTVLSNVEKPVVKEVVLPSTVMVEPVVQQQKAEPIQEPKKEADIYSQAADLFDEE